MSGAIERANRRASGPILTPGFLAVLDHNGMVTGSPGPPSFSENGYIVCNNYEMSRKIEDFGQILDEFFPIAIIVNFSQNSVE